MAISGRKRCFRFVVCETIALIALFASITAGMRERHARFTISEPVPPERVNFPWTALTISAAIVVALLPIVFYGPPRIR